MGIFVDILTDLGFTGMQAFAVRFCSVAVIYVVFLWGAIIGIICILSAIVIVNTRE